MKKKTIGILSGVGIVAVTATAIAVPLSLKNDDYVIPGKIIKDAKVLDSHEHKLFKKVFKTQTLGITDVLVKGIHDEDKNLIVIVTAQNKTDVIKVIFNVVKTTGKTTVLKIEKGPSDTKSIIENALKKNTIANLDKMKPAITELAKRIKNPNMITAIPDNVIEAIKILEDTVLNALSNSSKKSSAILKSEILAKLHEVLDNTSEKHLVKESHIMVASDDNDGSMVIKIDGIDDKTFSISGFLTNEVARILESKTTAIGEIDRITIPSQDDALHDASLHGAIATAKSAAITAINEAADIATINTVLTGERTKVNNAITAYTTSTGTTQALINAKSAAEVEIDNLNYPSQNDALHDASLFGAIATAKATAKTAINNAATPAAVTTVLNIEKAKVSDAINAYNSSIGTAKTLVDRKTEAIKEIKAILSPTQDNSLHDVTLFGAIASAKDDAEWAINNRANIETFNSILDEEKIKINNAITAYTTSTGTIQALINAKSSAEARIDGMGGELTQDDALHDASLFGAITSAKSSSKTAINNAPDIAAVTAALNAEYIKVNNAITAYTSSTGTIKALTDAKATAITAINNIVVPNEDDAAHQANLFGAIATTKAAAKTAINNAQDTATVTTVLNEEKTKVNNAITAYTTSTGTTQALINAKSVAEEAIDNLNYPVQDDGAHDTHLFGAIATAKATAKTAINNAPDTVTVTTVFKLIKKTVNDAITAYTTSTGTTQALINAKSAAEVEIDNLNYPFQNDDLHDASLFGAIATAKATAKTAINNAQDTAIVTTVLNGEKTKINSVINLYNDSNGENEKRRIINLVTNEQMNLPTTTEDSYSLTLDKPNDGITSSGVHFSFHKWEVHNNFIDWEVTLSFKGSTVTKARRISSLKRTTSSSEFTHLKRFVIENIKNYYNNLNEFEITQIREDKKNNLPLEFKEKTDWINIKLSIDQIINSTPELFSKMKDAQTKLKESIQATFNIYDFVIRMANGEFNKVITDNFEIPIGVNLIPHNAFKNATLPANFTLPEGITCIGEHAFDNATLPNSFNLPSTLKTILDYAFKSTDLPYGFNLPQGITWIGIGAFWKATIPTGFIIPSGITKICSETFSETILPNDFRLPDSITGIGSYAFYDVSLPNGFAIPRAASIIEFEAFRKATFNGNITLPNTVTYIGKNAFAQIQITQTFIIEEGITSIVAGMFQHVIFPSGFHLPESITTIKEYAFSYSTFPTGFNLPSNLSEIASLAFEGAFIPSGFTIPRSVLIISGSSFVNIRVPSSHRWFDFEGTMLETLDSPKPESTLKTE